MMGVPSPQLNAYWTAIPRLSSDPPVVYVMGVFNEPLVDPFGLFGGETVSGGSMAITRLPNRIYAFEGAGGMVALWAVKVAV
jgi:hypothetical protein